MTFFIVSLECPYFVVPVLSGQPVLSAITRGFVIF